MDLTGLSPYVTPEWVAQRLAVTPESIYRRLRRGTLKGRKLADSRLWRVERSAAMALLPDTAALPPALDQATALLGEMSADERLELARRALAVTR